MAVEMNFKHKSILALVIGLFLVAALSAQEVQPDAVFKQVTKEYTLNTDGSWDYHYRHSLKLLTYYAFHTLYGEDFIIYDPRFQELTINQSSTTMADGKLVTGPKNALNELLPSFAVNAPAFNHLREMAVTHTGLERGAVIDFDYTLHQSKEYSSVMSGNEVLWLTSPVEQFSLIIHVPKGVTLNYTLYNHEKKPEIIKKARETEYRWLFENLPATGREDFRPREQQNRPRLIFSTSKNFSKSVQDFSSQDAFHQKWEKGSPVIDTKLMTPGKDPRQLMMAIQDFVASEINYFPVPLASAAFKVRPPMQVFESNGGTEAEKAALLSSLLNYAGIQSEVLAIIPERFYHSKSSNLLQIERFLVKATPGMDEPVYLSAVQSDNYDQVYNLAGKILVSLPSGKTDKIGINDPIKSEIEIQSNLVMDNQMKLTGKVSARFLGKSNPYLKMFQDSSYSKKLLAGFADGSEIESYAIRKLNEDELATDYVLSSVNLTRNIAEHYFIRIPVLSSGIESWHANELVAGRTEPLEFPNQVSESYSYSITLPEGYELITAENNFQVKRPYGKFVFNISQEGRTVEITKSIDIQKTYFSKEEYADVKSFINHWNQRNFKECIIRKGPK